MRKIAVVTGSRAEYGSLYWIIKGIHEDPGLRLALIVTGTHLSSKFGLTVKEIERDGFPIAGKVKMSPSSDTDAAIAKSMGIGMVKFAKVYEELRPDILLVLGDRFEILSAVCAAMPFRMPVVHIHGGEVTEGAFDDSIRHAITKLSHIHFTATKIYRKRVIQLGEAPKNVFSFGAPGLDNISKLNLLSKKEILLGLAIPGNKKIGIFTYHPVTLEKNSALRQISELLETVSDFNGIYWVFTYPNVDNESSVIINKLRDFVKHYPERGKIFVSLGKQRYLSLLKYADLMLGNSSSGIAEAPSFGLPVINIGDRQKGRIHALNVIDVPECKKKYIIDTIHRATSSKFKKSLRGLRNPYFKKNASGRIVKKLKTIHLGDGLLKKRFFNIDFAIKS